MYEECWILTQVEMFVVPRPRTRRHIQMHLFNGTKKPTGNWLITLSRAQAFHLSIMYVGPKLEKTTFSRPLKTTSVLNFSADDAKDKS